GAVARGYLSDLTPHSGRRDPRYQASRSRDPRRLYALLVRRSLGAAARGGGHLTAVPIRNPRRKSPRKTNRRYRRRRRQLYGSIHPLESLSCPALIPRPRGPARISTFVARA